jgi:LysM repeat protein
MFPKLSVRILILFSLVIATLAFTRPASASSLPCGGNVTVVAGDTLKKIATRCDTTVSALMLANPRITNANLIYPGWVIVMPGALFKDGAGNDIYIVFRGDTLKDLATRFSTSLSNLLALNPGITNANLIYEGQRLMIATTGTPPPPPITGHTYIIQSGDTLKKIATRLGTTVDAILKVNPQITNPNLIYVGKSLAIPDGTKTYIVQSGDTLKKIAARFGTTLEALLKLNPTITNANLIYVNQVIVLW